MGNEFRLIEKECSIVWYPPSAEPTEAALPDQLVEILPRPDGAAGQPDAVWQPWYFAKVYDDDGIRFTQGLIERRYTKPLQQPVDVNDFALDCVGAAGAAGISAVDLFMAADYLSDIQNVPARTSSATGPFLFSESGWAASIANADLALVPSDRLWPFKQARAAAVEAANLREKFAAAAASAPTAADHVFVRLFGSASAELLAQAAQPGSPDPSIADLIESYCQNELKGSITKDALIDEISAAFPGLLGPPAARRKVSELREALQTALQARQQRAHNVVTPLQPELPQPKPVPPDVETSLKLGVNEIYRAEILAAAAKCDMDPAGLASLIDAEAAKLHDGTWDKNSQNPKSTAVGLTQFLKGTWVQMAKQAGTSLNMAGKDRGFISPNNAVTDLSRLLQMRTEPALSIAAAAEYAASNLKFVMRRNPPYRKFYDPGTPDGKMRLAYLCHHEGAGGALAYLRGAKDRSYVDWLDAYIDRKIVPSRFRTTAPVVGPGPDVGAQIGISVEIPGPAGAIPNNVMAVPAARPVAFAELQAPAGQWHWPVITGDSQAMKVSYRTGPNSVAGKPSREFLANRQGGRRFHVGMDIFCHQGDIVLAVADGKIINFYPFYEETNALFVQHAGVVINYGEVSPNSQQEFGWKIGGPVLAGQKIARVGRLNMIHFETYQPGTTQNARWMQDGSKAPGNLLNPTKVLLSLAAGGTRIR